MRSAKGEPVEVDCLAQFKIKSDDASIVAAAEHFLGKTAGDIKGIVRPVLEKHLRAALDGLGVEETGKNPGALADKVQAAAAADLGNMGLGIISFTIRDVRGG